MAYTVPQALLDRAKQLEACMEKNFPSLRDLAAQCYLSTAQTTVKVLEDGTTFVITGDIPAMWLRDSAAQVKPYASLCRKDEQVRKLVTGVIARHAKMVHIDPYANAFNASADGKGFKDETQLNDWVWERKYEIDSLCAPLYLAHDYVSATGFDDIFTPDFKVMIEDILATFRTEQDHARSPYTFQRHDCVESDTLPHEGRGNPVEPTGMTWSGFRPSDDACQYGYLIPSNMMAVVALGYAADFARERYRDETLAARCEKLAAEIDAGIERYGIVEHEKFGKIYAYETDGRGNYNLMDDANSPSLLSIPYLGYRGKDDEIYQNTRRFVLSGENPYYYTGKYAHGVGSPHTPKGYIWHIALVMQALTSSGRAEILECLEMIASTHAGTNYMHEGFNPDDPSQFTRDWFAWANTIFAQLLTTLEDGGFWNGSAN